MSAQDSAYRGTRPASSRIILSGGSQLMSRLDVIRTLRMMIGTGSGFIWSGIASLATLIAWMWADVVLNLSPGVRVAGWGSAAVVLGGLLIQRIHAMRRTATSSAVASDLDRLTSSGGQIRTGMDLAQSIKKRSQSVSPLTMGLAELAIRNAATVANRPASTAAASPLPIAKSLAAASGAFVFCLILSIMMPRMTLTELQRFFDPYGGYPAWSQFQFTITPNASSVIYGESLEVEATVAGPPFEQLEMVLIPVATANAGRKVVRDVESLDPIDVLPMFSDATGVWRASIVNITDPFEFFLRIRRARSETVSVDVITVPDISDVKVEVAAPLYTGLSSYRGVVPPKGIEGLPGTRVTITASSNRPLSGGRLELHEQHDESAQIAADAMVEQGSGVSSVNGPAVVAMSVESDPHTVTGEFIVAQPGQFHVYVTDVAGQSNLSPLTIPIRLLQDQSPMVRLAQPRAVSFATPEATIPVVVAAEDDYGLRRCQLFRSLNNSRPLPTDLSVPEGSPRRVFLQSGLPLAAYHLQPGDEIRLFARVEDNDPNSPAAPIGKGAESSIVSIRIISEAEFNRSQQQRVGLEMMMSRHQQAQRRLESLTEKMRELKEKLDAADADSELSEQLRGEMQELADQMKEAADAIQKLADSPLPFAMDQELAAHLSEMADALSEMSEQTGDMSSQPGLSRQQAAEKMEQQLEALKQEQQEHQSEAMKPLQHLAKVLPLKQDEAAFTQLVQRQRSLADRLQALKNATIAAATPAERARMRELEEEQHRLRTQLTDLLDKIDEDISELPDDPELDDLRNTAQEFVDAVRASEADTMMADGESALSKSDGREGAAWAEDAATTLEQFLSQCNSMGQAGNSSCLKFSPSLGSSMAKTLDQLVPGMGSKPGGMAAGSGGGYSTQSSTMDNVGMYGTTPMIDSSQATSGNSDTDAAVGIMSQLSGDGSDQSGSGFSTNQSNSAFGNSETGVPSQYRRQAGQYMQRLAEELEQ